MRAYSTFFAAKRWQIAQKAHVCSSDHWPIKWALSAKSGFKSGLREHIGRKTAAPLLNWVKNECVKSRFAHWLCAHTMKHESPTHRALFLLVSGQRLLFIAIVITSYFVAPHFLPQRATRHSMRQTARAQVKRSSQGRHRARAHEHRRGAALCIPLSTIGAPVQGAAPFYCDANDGGRL